MNHLGVRAIINNLRPDIGMIANHSFTSWIKDAIASAPISSNIPSQHLPFQRWYHFKEAFSPLLVLEAIQSLGYWPSACLDCFGGSGTTSLSCQFLGVHPTTIEVNPFLADLIEAKLASYDRVQLREDFLGVRNAAKITRIDLRTVRHEAWPATMVEPGVDGRWLFPKETFKRILALREAISGVDSHNNRLLLRVLLGSILVDMSNITISGKARRYRTNWRALQKSPEDVDQAFQKGFNEALFDIANFSQRLCSSFDLLRGDARTKVTEVGDIDIALFSPPYPNSFDYTDIYNIELWVLGYLKSKSDNLDLRAATLRSHVQICRDMSWEGLESPLLRKTVADITARRGRLWNPHIPDMIGAYFFDLHMILQRLRKKMRPEGAVVMTVGDSRYADVLVDVGEILSELAPSAGFYCETIQPIRSMKSSAQQGWSMSLSEEIVRFRPA
jgi:hypothetical protein